MRTRGRRKVAWFGHVVQYERDKNIKLHYEGLKYGNGLQTDTFNKLLGNKVLEERNITDTIDVTYRNMLDEHEDNNKGKNNSKTIPNRYEILNKSNFGKISKKSFVHE